MWLIVYFTWSCGSCLGIVGREAFCQGEGCLLRSGLSGPPVVALSAIEGKSQAKLGSPMCSQTGLSQRVAHQDLNCGDAGVGVCVCTCAGEGVLARNTCYEMTSYLLTVYYPG